MANALKVDIRHKNNGSQRHLNLTWLCILEVLSSGTDEHYTDIETSGQIRVLTGLQPAGSA